MTEKQRISFVSKSNRTWKSGWRTIGGKKKYYRSRWEANYARFLQWLLERQQIASWEHEPETFWFEEIRRGTRSYLPDFKVIEKNGAISYHEVKGWMDPASATKLKRMKKYHPHIRVDLIGAGAYKSIERTVSRMIPDWESG